MQALATKKRRFFFGKLTTYIYIWKIYRRIANKKESRQNTKRTLALFAVYLLRGDAMRLGRGGAMPKNAYFLFYWLFDCKAKKRPYFDAKG